MSRDHRHIAVMALQEGKIVFGRWRVYLIELDGPTASASDDLCLKNDVVVSRRYAVSSPLPRARLGRNVRSSRNTRRGDCLDRLRPTKASVATADAASVRSADAVGLNA